LQSNIPSFWWPKPGPHHVRVFTRRGG